MYALSRPNYKSLSPLYRKSLSVQLAEMARHNKYIEAIATRGKGFRLRPWGYGLKKQKKKLEALPKRPLTNVEFTKYAKNLPYFRGVHMIDDLPKDSPHYRESAIVNLD